MTPILKHVRSNVIAYLALFVALGGTGYAATSLPRGSVGPRQLNHRLIGGYVRAWARVNGSGHALAASSRVQVLGTPPSGPLTIRWTGRFPHSQDACTVVATPDGVGPNGTGASLVARYEGSGKVQFVTSDNTFPYDVSAALIC